MSICKVSFFGESGVGKTSIIKRLTKNSFDESQGTTAGSKFHIEQFQCEELNFRLKLWDHAGQKIYRQMNKLFFKEVDIIVVVFSLSENQFENSFEAIKKYWIPEIKEKGKKYLPLLIFGNKDDLIENKQIRFGKIKPLLETLRQEYNIHYFTGNAKLENDSGLKSLLREIGRQQLLIKERKQKQSTGIQTGSIILQPKRISLRKEIKSCCS